MPSLRRDERTPPSCATGVSVYRASDGRRHRYDTRVRAESQEAISLREVWWGFRLAHHRVAGLARTMGFVLGFGGVWPADGHQQAHDAVIRFDQQPRLAFSSS